MVFALAAKSGGTVTASRVMLPLLALTSACLAAVDIIAYRKDKKEDTTVQVTELIRIVGLIVLTVLLVISVIYINL